MSELLTINIPIPAECCQDVYARELEFEPEPSHLPFDERGFFQTITGDEFLAHREFILK